MPSSRMSRTCVRETGVPVAPLGPRLLCLFPSFSSQPHAVSVMQGRRLGATAETCSMVGGCGQGLDPSLGHLGPGVCRGLRSSERS